MARRRIIVIITTKIADILFIAVNEEFACSKSSFSSIIPKESADILQK